MDDRDFADFCFLALRANLLPLEAVRAWADDIISTRDDAPGWALNLSTADFNGAISALNAVREVSTGGVAVQLIGALVRRRWQDGQLSLREVERIGWQLHIDDRLPQPATGGDWGVVLFCEYEEFERGYRTEAEMRGSVEEKLAPFAAFEQNLPAWVDSAVSPDPRQP